MKRFATVCSGIGAPEVAAQSLGWECVFSADIEAFPNAIRAHHWPGVPNLGDITKFKDWPDYAIEILAGGTPCQSFSVAGQRGGLDDPRGQLMLTYVAIAAKYRPRWLLWENVPGVLSSNGGRDFAELLGLLTGCVVAPPADGWGTSGWVSGSSDAYGIAWRVLDAQYFGVAQRRRRVFVIGHIGGCWERAAAVLFEREGLRGDSAPSRKAGQGVAGTITKCSFVGGAGGKPEGAAVGIDGGDIGFSLRANASHSGDKGDGGMNTTMICATLTKNYAAHYGRTAGNNGGVAENQLLPVAFPPTNPWPKKVADTLTASYATKQGLENQHIDGGCGLFTGTHGVRRLTPTECERLQGFPDNFTAFTGTKRAADSPRYKALGNSMAVPVIKWIFQQIEAVDKI